MVIEEWLVGLVFSTLLVFLRIGAAFIALPGLGSLALSSQIRLLLALAFALVLTPALSEGLPPQPDTLPALVGLIVSEVLVGLFIGTVAKILMASLETAGMIISQQIGLANAFLFDPSQGGQTSVAGAMLGQIGIVLLFVTDLHHLLLRALWDSYALFPAGQILVLGDASDVISQTVSGSFWVGFRMAAPLVVVSLLFFLAMGLINRLMPQLPVFFIGQPVQIFVGMVVFLLTLMTAFGVWLGYFDSQMVAFLLDP